MRTASFVPLSFALITSSSDAQLGISKGLIGGLNLASLSGADVSSDAESVATFAGGVFLEISFPGPLSIEAEGLYSRKGSKYSASVSTLTDTYTYADIPVLLKYYFHLPALKAYVCAGPTYSILLKANRRTEVAYTSSVDTDIKNMLAANDISATIGIGARFSIIRVDARYNFGMKTIDKTGILNVYNRVAALYGGIEF